MSEYYYYKRYKKYKNLYKNLQAGGEEASDKPATQFDTGTEVEIEGLSSEKGRDLNGRKGNINGVCPDMVDGRCRVKIPGDKEVYLISPANLKLVTSDSVTSDSATSDSVTSDSATSDR